MYEYYLPIQPHQYYREGVKKHYLPTVTAVLGKERIVLEEASEEGDVERYEEDAKGMGHWKWEVEMLHMVQVGAGLNTPEASAMKWRQRFLTLAQASPTEHPILLWKGILKTKQLFCLL